MKLPRDVNGRELASLLSKFGYHVTRQAGSHLRLSSSLMGAEHHVTVPDHHPLKTGTLNGIIKEIAAYLEKERAALIDELFE